MANHVIKTPSVFDLVMQKISTTDKVHADSVNTPFEKLINNDAYLRDEIRALKGGTKKLPGITIKPTDWKTNAYTVTDVSITTSSICDVYFSGVSVPDATKAQIVGSTQVGKMVLTAKKVPTVNIVIDVIFINNL